MQCEPSLRPGIISLVTLTFMFPFLLSYLEVKYLLLYKFFKWISVSFIFSQSFL